MHVLLSALLFCLFFAMLLVGLVRVLRDMMARDLSFTGPAPGAATAPGEAQRPGGSSLED